MPTTLINLIGNRDLQIKTADLPLDLKGIFVPNNDDQEYSVIKKDDNKFLEYSEFLYENLERFINVIEFPIIQKAIDSLEGKELIEKLIITTTKQSPLDKQDCHFIAEIALHLFKNKGHDKIEYLPFDFRPTDFEKLATFLISIYTQNNNSKIYVNNTGGTPEMRAATYFAGIFKGIEFITINARTKSSDTKNFKKQEKMILQHTIENMLKVYDYQGIANLPVTEEVKKKCYDANDLYNLKTDFVAGEGNYGEQSKQAIKLLMDNMHVCFVQGRYADVIGRMFRIEESVWQLLLYQDWKSRGLINDSDKVKRINSKGQEKFEYKFIKYLKQADQMEEFVLQNFPDMTERKQVNETLYYFFSGTEVPLRSGKSFFYYYFKNINDEKTKQFCSFFEKMNNNFQRDNPLGELRNSSIAGHGVKGVNLQDIENIIGPFSDFENNLKELLHHQVNIEVSNIFDERNEEILNLIN
jgi:hypothetical protein